MNLQLKKTMFFTKNLKWPVETTTANVREKGFVFTPTISFII